MISHINVMATPRKWLQQRVQKQHGFDFIAGVVLC
jgi:hypothetical protein